MMRHLWLPGWCFLCLFLNLRGAEIIPPPPKAWFNDYASVVPAQDVAALNSQLEEFEKTTSNQIMVAIFPKMESDSSVEDYTVRVAQKWGVGQKGKNNGVVLFVFVQDHKIYLQVGYGLEGALPDATAKLIIENEIKPSFKRGDYAGGLRAGINAIIAATKGEYKGTGSINSGNDSGGFGFFIFLIFLFFFAPFFLQRWFGWGRGSTIYSGGGMSGWGGGSSGGFSGGGFSGGGGSFGGGGAGGGW
jgi:uncharacterized protein